MKLKVRVDTAYGPETHIVDTARVDASGVLAVGDGKETNLYAPGFWMHAHVAETEDEAETGDMELVEEDPS